MKHDASFLKFMVTITTKDNKGVFERINYAMHPCTEADYAKFSPSDTNAHAKMTKIQNAGGLYCLDWKENGKEIFGAWATGSSYRAIDI